MGVADANLTLPKKGNVTFTVDDGWHVGCYQSVDGTPIRRKNKRKIGSAATGTTYLSLVSFLLG
jgi:hypothetical protein